MLRLASLASQATKPQLRAYATHPRPPRFERLFDLAPIVYVSAAFTLPFVPPYLARQRAARDGVELQRPTGHFCNRCVW
jgi:hypothetical protein